MLRYDLLKHLHSHYDYLTEQLGQADLFFVWGAVRDLLLWTITDPTDIDLTCATPPQQLRDQMWSDEISRFKTDKFGTITLIPKERPVYQYEVTPFRQEGWYDDYRHPDEINWTTDLLLDSQRRDFTINCIYRTSAHLLGTVSPQTTQSYQSDQELLERLDADGVIYLADHHLLILQDQSRIDALLTNGSVNQQELTKLLEKVTHLSHWSWSLSSDRHLSILIDPQHGIDDLIQGQIRTVGDPHLRFGEDALRIMRGARFANTLNQQINPDEQHYFDFESSTWKSMKKNYYLVSYVAKERLQLEIKKVFQGRDPFGYVALIDELNLLGILFPAVANTKHVDQPVRYHPFDVYNHTILCLRELQEINNHRLARLAMLYHDVGKPDQYHFYSLHIVKDEKKLPVAGQMYHTNIWVELAQRDFKQLGCSNKEINEICWYISKHHRPGELLDAKPENIPKKLRKLISEADIQWIQNLLDIAIADRRGQYNPLQPPAVQWLFDLKVLADQIYNEEGRFTLKEMAINGNDLIQAFDLSPSPRLGKLLDQAFERVIEDLQQRNTKKKILDYLRQSSIET